MPSEISSTDCIFDMDCDVYTGSYDDGSFGKQFYRFPTSCGDECKFRNGKTSLDHIQYGTTLAEDCKSKTFRPNCLILGERHLADGSRATCHGPCPTHDGYANALFLY